MLCSFVPVDLLIASPTPHRHATAPLTLIYDVLCGCCRHSGVPCWQSTQVLLPGDEHSSAGGTSNHRMYHWHWHRSSDDTLCQRFVCGYVNWYCVNELPMFSIICCIIFQFSSALFFIIVFHHHLWTLFSIFAAILIRTVLDLLFPNPAGAAFCWISNGKL